MGSQRIEVIHLKSLEVEPDDDVLQKLYTWVDEIPLTRPKKNLARDFSDGVMTAELVQHFVPKLVQLHNYVAANASSQKESNWFHLNKKVFIKLKFEITPEVIRALAQCRKWVAENFLMLLREMMDVHMAQTQVYTMAAEAGDIDAVTHLDQPEVDQHTTEFRQKEKQLKNFTQKSQPTQDKYSPSGHNENVYRGAQFRNAEMVPRHYLEDKERELEVRSQTVQILNAKIKKMEHLLTLKDMRIEDLSIKINEQKRNKITASKPTGQKRS